VGQGQPRQREPLTYFGGHNIAAEAGQIFQLPVWADWGIDGEIEFKETKGQLSD